MQCAGADNRQTLAIVHLILPVFSLALGSVWKFQSRNQMREGVGVRWLLPLPSASRSRLLK